MRSFFMNDVSALARTVLKFFFPQNIIKKSLCYVYSMYLYMITTTEPVYATSYYLFEYLSRPDEIYEILLCNKIVPIWQY